jgi:hypothetical protein
VPQVRETVGAVGGLADHEASLQGAGAVLPGQRCGCLISGETTRWMPHSGENASVRMRQDSDGSRIIGNIQLACPVTVDLLFLLVDLARSAYFATVVARLRPRQKPFRRTGAPDLALQTSNH